MRANVSRRRTYLVIAILALAAGLSGVRGRWNLAAPPSDLATSGIAYPAREGAVDAATPAELRFLVQSRPAGSVAEIRSPDMTHRSGRWSFLGRASERSTHTRHVIDPGGYS